MNGCPGVRTAWEGGVHGRGRRCARQGGGRTGIGRACTGIGRARTGEYGGAHDGSLCQFQVVTMWVESTPPKVS
jgi:hypothetical protein